MPRCLPVPLSPFLNLRLLEVGRFGSLLRYSSTSAKFEGRRRRRVSSSFNEACTTGDLSLRDSLALLRTPGLPIRVIQALPRFPKRPQVRPPKNHGRWSLRSYTRRINGLISYAPPDTIIPTIKRLALSFSIPAPLRSHVLTKASILFLRHKNLSGALFMYKLLISQGFVPPLSLTTAIYRTRDIQSNKIDNGILDQQVLSIASMNCCSLALLLSTLESSRQPEVMESIVQKYACQVSDSCLKDASVASSMIRAYHAAEQLDGCYEWFYRYRNGLPTNDERPQTTPYICMMTACRKLNPKNTRFLYRIVSMMQEDDAPITTFAYNELLASEVHNRNFKQAFSLFSTFQRSLDVLRPDAHTFSLVFDLLWKNVTGPRFDFPQDPRHILDQMFRISRTDPSVLTVFNINAALRYFVHVGDFQSAIVIVDAVLSARLLPNTLMIRWVLEELLKRCQRAFNHSASLELENWARVFLGGLTRDHFAHVAHFLDIARSIRTNTESFKLTKTAQSALRLVHNAIVSRRSRSSLSSKDCLRDTPVLAMIRDLFQVCEDPTDGLF